MEINTKATINQELGSFNKPFKSGLIPVLVMKKKEGRKRKRGSEKRKKEVRWRFRWLNNVTITTQQRSAIIGIQNMLPDYDALRFKGETLPMVPYCFLFLQQSLGFHTAIIYSCCFLSSQNANSFKPKGGAW